MLRLFLFDIRRWLRGPRSLRYAAVVEGLGRVPEDVRKDLGFEGDLVFARALSELKQSAASQLEHDARTLLVILSAIAVARGFPS